jgi:O-antigen ligase
LYLPITDFRSPITISFMDLPVPFIVAIGLAVGVWGLVFALRLPTLHACLAALLAVSCFGASFARWDIGPINLSADRFLLAALVPFFIVKRLLTSQPRFGFDRIDAALIGLLALLTVSVMTHAVPPKAEATPTPLFLLLTSFIMPSLVYWIVRMREPLSGRVGQVIAAHHDTQGLVGREDLAHPTRRNPSDLCVVAGFFVLFGIYLACTAICEEFHITALIFPRYILKERLLYVGRSVGPFLSAPVLGTWLTVAAVSAVVLRNHVQPLVRVLLLAALPLLAVGEYLTKTRSAWLGFAAAVPLAMYFAGTRVQRRMVLFSAACLAFLATAYWGEKILSPDRGESRSVVAYSTNQRLALLQRSVALFARRPITGWGFRHFEFASRTEGGGGPLKLVSPEAAQGLASHNTLLRFVVETGVVGTSLLLLIFGYWANRSRQAIARLELATPERDMAILFLGGLVAYCSEAMFHDLTFMMHENLLIFFLAGCLCSCHPAAGQLAPSALQCRLNEKDAYRVERVYGLGSALPGR